MTELAAAPLPPAASPAEQRPAEAEEAGPDAERRRRYEVLQPGPTSVAAPAAPAALAQGSKASLERARHRLAGISKSLHAPARGSRAEALVAEARSYAAEGRVLAAERALHELAAEAGCTLEALREQEEILGARGWRRCGEGAACWVRAGAGRGQSGSAEQGVLASAASLTGWSPPHRGSSAGLDVGKVEREAAEVHAVLSELADDEGYMVSRDDALRVLYKHEVRAALRCAALRHRAALGGGMLSHRLGRLLGVGSEVRCGSAQRAGSRGRGSGLQQQAKQPASPRLALHTGTPRRCARAEGRHGAQPQVQGGAGRPC